MRLNRFAGIAIVAAIYPVSSGGAAAAPASWVFRGPYGGITTTVVVDPHNSKILYLGTWYRGVFKSTNGGSTWTWISASLSWDAFQVHSLAIDPQNPQTVYAGSSKGRISKTIDGGETWAVVHLGNENARVPALCVDAADPKVVFAGVAENARGEVLKSTDSGSSWKSCGSVGAVHDLRMHPTDRRILFAATSKGLYKSADSGGSWTAIGTFEYASSVSLDPLNPNTIYATGDYAQKSTDGGATWSQLGFQPNNWGCRLVMDPVAPGTVYVANKFDGLSGSTDGGATWAADPAFRGRVVWDVAVDPASHKVAYAATYGDGVFKSAGGKWRSTNKGLSAMEVRALVFDPARPNRVCAATNAGVYRSTDHGNTWSTGTWMPAGSSGSDVYQKRRINTLAVDLQGTIYAGSDAGVFKSADGGLKWTEISNGLLNKTARALAVDRASSSVLYAGTLLGVYKTTDGGAAWRQCASGVLGQTSVTSVAVDPTDSNVVYAGTWNKGVFRSANAGGAWTPSRAGMGSSWSVSSFAINPTNPKMVYASTIGAHIFQSSDGGKKWKRNCSGLDCPYVYAVTLDPADPAVVYVSGGSGVYRSSHGALWEKISPADFDFYLPIADVVIDPSDTRRVLAGTYGGVWSGLMQ
ncbi:MAG: hypothetical protein AB1714_29065 [Acidobacteriota bacterium]